jgi:simple sugar transport system permease protein
MGRRPAVLKVYRGAHEVISTIMMNYVANGVLLSLLSGALKDPGQRGAIAQQQTPQVEPTAQVGSMVPFFNSIGFDFRGSAAVTWFFVLALVGALVYALTVRRTRFGFELQVLGTNPRAAEPAGIRSNAMILKAMLLSGAIPGLAGLQDVLAIDDRMKLDYIRGYGFTAIAVALLGRNSGVGIVAAALLPSFLDRASPRHGSQHRRAQGGHLHPPRRDHPHHRGGLRGRAPAGRPRTAAGAEHHERA